MSLYLIGDVQGCHEAFTRLLQALDFSPSRDRLYVLGDLVNRGPDNVGVLRRLRDLGDSARCLLGNSRSAPAGFAPRPGTAQTG